MSTPNARRIMRVLTSEEQDRLRRRRGEIATELPDLIAKDRMRHEARSEPTLSGELRRAVHRSTLSLTTISQQAGIQPQILDEFLTGERTLRSDVVDRLAATLGFVLHSEEQ